MYRSRFKKIHLDDAQCIELSHSVEGSKSLRMPMEFRKASSFKNHLLPRRNLKRGFSAQNPELCEDQYVGFESNVCTDDLKCQKIENITEVSALTESVISQGFQSASHLISNQKLRSFSECSAAVGVVDGFISAKQFMNPTHHLCNDAEDRKIPANESTLRTSSQSSIRKRSKNSVIQKNNLDQYFKKVPIEKHPSSSGSDVSQSSPRHSVLYSPISKVSGTDSIYYSPKSVSIESLKTDLKNCETSSARKSLWSDDNDFETPNPRCLKGGLGSKSKGPKRGAKALTSSKRSSVRSQVSNLEAKNLPKQVSADVTDGKFGLFGFSESELMELADDTDLEDEDVKPGIDYFSRLPLDIVENIFCRLPFADLHLNVNRVCTLWKDIICSSTFMPWKKNYFRLLRGDKEAYLSMQDLMKANSMHSLELYLPSLIRLMKTFKPGTGRGGMDDSLKKHPKYNLAKELLTERFQDCFLCDQVPNAWCIIATFVILSESVRDLRLIFGCLLGGQSLCMASELLDGLYCIISFLWMFKSLRLDDVWNGMHYRVYYALYLYENESVSTVGQLSDIRNQPGQQSLYRYSVSDAILRLTHEQMRICNHHVEPGQTIKIIAFAGTGKTTTLIQYTKMRPNTRFLLVVYNKSVCAHSKTRFPSNVSCSTAHSLAYRAVGWKYRKADKLGSNVKLMDILNLLQTRKGENLYTQAKLVVETLNGFMASSDPFITTAHVPTELTIDGVVVNSIDHSVRMNLANDAQIIWDHMVNIHDKSVSLPHDGYLKLWQLQKPRIQKYDVILIDEAQDLTPTVADIFLTQLQPKMLVGDPHQQIYSFRGAVNAMNLIAPTHTFYLTQSFRFGPEIAFVAASCLELFKKEKTKILVGNGIPGSIYGDQTGQLAIIARSNFQLFCEIVRKCCYSDEKIKVSFAGGIEGYGFDMVEDIYYLISGKDTNLIRHPLIKRFVSDGFAQFNNFAQKTYDKELLVKISIVTKFMHTIPSHISHIRKKYVADPDLADVIFTTAHKSKGLEFDTVHISDDFIEPPTATNVRSATDDEYNLLYVAVTRAKKRLVMSKPLLKALDRVGEQFFYPVSTRELKRDNGELMECSAEVTVAATDAVVAGVPVVTMMKRKLCLSDGLVISSKVMTPVSVSESIHSMTGIAGPIS